MKKLNYIIFAFAFLLLAGSISILGFGGKNNVPSNTDITNAEELSLNLTVEDEISLVQGQTKQFFVTYTPGAILNLTLSNDNVVLIDENYVIHALSSGQVSCIWTITYKNKTLTKNTTISVTEKNITFDLLNQDAFAGFKAGLKANSSYQTYTLAVNSNYDLSQTTFEADEHIKINSIDLFQEGKQAIISFYLTQAGEFRFVIDNFVFSQTATSYINDLPLQFSQDVFENDVLSLYRLIENKQEAYQDHIYDFATLQTNLSNFEVQIENNTVATFQQNNFQALSQGQTNVSFCALDGSGYVKQILISVGEIVATSCEISGENNICMQENGSYNLCYSNFIPCYATVKNVSITTSENLTVSGCNQYIFSEESGQGQVTIYLNNFFIKSIIVTVEEENIPPVDEEGDGEIPPQNLEYSLFIVASQIVVDQQNMTMTFAAIGQYDIRLYLLDKDNKNIPLNTLSVDLTELNQASIEGSVVHLNIIDNGTITITFNGNTFVYQILIG